MYVFFSGILTSTPQLILRICACLKALETATLTLKGEQHLHGKIDTRSEFIFRCLIEKQTRLMYTIDTTIFNRALKLMEYFNMSKLILAGLPVDSTMSYIDAMDILIP